MTPIIYPINMCVCGCFNFWLYSDDLTNFQNIIKLHNNLNYPNYIFQLNRQDLRSEKVVYLTSSCSIYFHIIESENFAVAAKTLAMT